MAYRYFTRRFLNRRHHHSTGFVLAEITKTKPTQDRWDADAGLTIGDCGRQISLDFPLYSHGDRQNSLYKAELLVDVLTRFRDALVEEAAVAVEREALEKAKKKAERSRESV